MDYPTPVGNMTMVQFQVAFSPLSGRVDPDCNIYTFHYTKGPDNNSNVSDPQLDDLLDRARAESSPEARKKLYADAIAIILERRSNIYLWFSNVFTAASSRVSGYEMYVDGMPRLKNVSLSPGG